MNEFRRVVRYKINTQKSPAFLYTNNNLSENEIKKTIPFIIASRLPRWLSSKESTCRRCKRYGFNLWVRKIPGGGNGNPLQYSGLKNTMDRGAWQAIVHAVVKNQTQLSEHAHTITSKRIKYQEDTN